MLEKTVNPILKVLGEHPSGITARRVADVLKMPAGRASTRLSRLALYGVIKRVALPERGTREYAYQLRQDDQHVQG